MLLYEEKKPDSSTQAITIAKGNEFPNGSDWSNLSSSFAVPPKELMEYGESSEVHLQEGKETVENMRQIVQRNGKDFKDFNRIMEFGCANGRLLRWLADGSEHQEIWGVDIQSDKIAWAIENLSPPLNFAVNTTVPSLPFADSYFDFIYAGSIFSHINELHISWLLEISRVLAPNGLAYLTFHDEHTLDYCKANPSNRIGQIFSEHPLSEEIYSSQYDFISVNPYGSAGLSQVLMHSRYIKKITQSVFNIVEVAPNAYSGLQTAYLFSLKS